jgi:hypothetical protein
MNRSLNRALLLVAVSVLLAISVGAWPLSNPVPQDQGTANATKKSTANPKKPAAAKSTTDADKIKTDERMSTRGLKPPAKTADKDKNAKPDAKSSSTPDSANPK